MNEIPQMHGIRSLVSSVKVSSARRELAAERLATGNSVNSALDNPTNFFAAMNHLSRAKDFEQLVSTITEGIQTVKTAINGIEAISKLVESMKGILAAAQGDKNVSSRESFASSFDQVLSQINSIANDSSYRGLNLIGRHSADRMNFNADDLTITFNPEATSTLTVKGTFLGSEVILNDPSGGTPWVTSLDGTSLETGKEGTFSIGNLTKLELITVFNRPLSGNIDSNHNGVIQPGEGMDIDVRGTASASADANNVNITNITIPSAFGFNPWNFQWGTSSSLGDIPMGTSSTTIPNGTDIDLNVAAGIPADTRFRISFDVTSDGQSVSMLFGPYQLDKLQNNQVSEGFSANLSTITLKNADYSSNQFTLTFNDPPPPFDKTLNADRKGLGILPSFMYDSFKSDTGINAAISDLESAMSKLRINSKAFAVNLDIPAIRKEFTSSIIAVTEIGAMNLTAADMNEEGAVMLMSTTQMNISMTSLSLSITGSQDILKLLNT